MDWQWIAVALILLASFGYLVRATWKTWFGRKAGCASGCGQCKEPAPEEPGKRIALPRV